MDSALTPDNTAAAPRWPVTGVGRCLLGGYAVAGYALSLVSVAYLVGFLADLGVPKDIDSGSAVPTVNALVVDSTLVLLFGLQHSVMARPWFKDASSRPIRFPAQRTTYVLATGATLLVTFWLWRPLPTTVWLVEGPAGQGLTALYAAGVVFTVAATFQVSHTDLFGLRQSGGALADRPYSAPGFVRAGLHRWVRHPIMTGFLVMVWTTPHLTLGHLFFAACLTGYIAVGTHWEERDLVAVLGADYADYRRQVPAVLPLPRHLP